MKLIEALNGGHTPESLKMQYAISHKRHSTHQNLVLFKYSQIDSPMSERLVQEARGVILDESNRWSVVSRPFDKFFNYEEGFAAKVDWSTARYFEKLDGSLCTLYHYNGTWHVSTSGVPDAQCPVFDYGFTFGELFWKVFADSGYSLPSDTNLCFMFELMTPYNRVVVRHDFNRLVLIGVRDVRTGQEFMPSPAYGFNVVKSFTFYDLSGLLESFKNIDPVKQEGFVVCDNQFNRVKVKHPGYVALHHMKSGVSVRRLIEVVLSSEYSELLSYFPEYTERVDEIKGKLAAAIATAESDFRHAREQSTDRKSFAAIAIKSKYSAALFKAYGSNDQGMIAAYIRSIPANKLSDMLNIEPMTLGEA